ncbi:alkaline phosphatase family protein, partial [Kribbella sp. NPDC050124]|uniref:alkaline phosphatase family protein n=1 Tax=Kribbella sp. NPDC050124 TaxID=3364114 RepID=UPI0037965D8B
TPPPRPAMLTDTSRWSHARGNEVVPSRWQATDDFFEDAEQGRLPTYSFIEPNLLHAHNDYHPAYNALFPGLSADSPSSILRGGGAARSRLFGHPHLVH